MNTIEKILDLIAKNNITEKKLTLEAGIPHSSITEWKKGKAKPSTEAIIKIARYFNVSADYLLNLTDDSTPPNSEDKEDDDHGLVIIQRLRKNLPPADNERMVNVIKAMFDESFPKDKNKEKDDNVQK